MQELLKDHKKWCIMPFVHLHVNENDQLKLCCFSDPVKNYKTNFDFIHDIDYQNIRSKMISDESVSLCQRCYDMDDLGAESLRVRNSLEWAEKLNLKSISEVETKILYYDIRNDNTCNLNCRICHPGASSQLVKEYQTIGWFHPIGPRSVKLSEIIDFTSVEKVFVAGGEPTIMPEFQKFLARAIEHGRQDLEIMVSTNGTNINRRLCKLLESFSNLHFTVSIDGYKDINRYIRWPSDWGTIVKNVHKLQTLTDHVCFNICVNIWNITSLCRLCEFLESEFPVPIILLNEAIPNARADFSPFMHPNKKLVLSELEKCKKLSNYQIDDFFRNKIDYFIAKTLSTPMDLDRLRKFFDYNDQLDRSRGIELKNYVPDLDACRLELGI